MGMSLSMWGMLGIRVAIVDKLVCGPVNVNTVLFIWPMLACVVGLAVSGPLLHLNVMIPCALVDGHFHAKY